MRKRLERLAGNEHAVFIAVVVVALGVYRTTVCPTVSFTDSGELATVAATLGIAHPTGYPLWTLLGRIASSLPVGSEAIVRLNGLSGLITALGVGFFFKFVLVLFRSRRLFRIANEGNKRLPSPLVFPVVGSAALVFGFSSTVWAQSVEIEVYALHLLIVLIAAVLFVGGVEEQLTRPGYLSRRLLLFSFVLGLAFANHMTTVLLAPAFLYLYFTSLGFNRRSWSIVLALIPFFLIGISLYLYLPIRSTSGPLMDWGHPVTLERLWWHVTGKQYQTWMFAGWPVVEKQLGYFFTNFATEFQGALTAFLLFGLVRLAAYSRRLFTFVMVLFVTCIAYTVNYDINEIDPYFILAYVSCGIVIATGVQQVVLWMWNRSSLSYRTVGVLLLILLPVIQVLNNRHDVDQSGNYQAEDFVKNAFSELEPNAVVFSSLWDYFVSPAYYLQQVRNLRPDVTIIDRALLQDRTWYFIQFARRHPGILERSKDAMDGFLVELNKFENEEPFEYLTIKRRWDGLLRDLTGKLMEDRPVYVDIRIAGDFPQDFEEIPQGLFVRLTKRGVSAEWKPVKGDFRDGGFSDYVSDDLKRYAASILTYHAVWLAGTGHLPEARQAISRALAFDSSFVPALRFRAQIQK